MKITINLEAYDIDGNKLEDEKVIQIEVPDNTECISLDNVFGKAGGINFSKNGDMEEY